MIRRAEFGLGLINLSQYPFDLDYFISYTRIFHPLDDLYNSFLFDFHLDKIYYIHLIDDDDNIISVVPYDLSSNLEDHKQSVDDSFLLLEADLRRYLANNPGYQGSLVIYMCDSSVNNIDVQDLLVEYAYLLREHNKLLLDDKEDPLNLLAFCSLFKDKIFKFNK